MPRVIYVAHDDVSTLSGIKKLFQATWSARLVGWNLLRDRTSKRYAGSFLGVVWSLLSPLLTLIAIALVFPLLMRMKMENYVVYLFSGLVVWRFVVSSLKAGGDSILSSKTLVQKVALPSILFPMVVTASEFVNFLLVFVALNVVALFFNFAISPHWGYFILAAMVTLVFCMGLAAVFSVVVVYLRDIKYVLDVITQAFFYLTPIIYPISLIPEQYRIFMEFNVFMHFVELFHQAIYYQGVVDWSLFVIPTSLAVLMFFAGAFVHVKWGRMLVYHV
ncbi:ABC-2 type transport system permease protein/lipopolysaccharide transport system permease protein [Mariprofundus aestuarium]|uniref:Transport permease protein n=1 Tax=Mariprofundus aestuarium TaxID=1921086 RepID=A0A2K8KZ73_MARES|nr:ABC transporter permease [Mariprofundus aestuarium]ATX80298.1 ABC-2 type transport system permease protein/lipopolysaccharide transport system permease protein [Mariprofundus aestuarium]